LKRWAGTCGSKSPKGDAKWALALDFRTVNTDQAGKNHVRR
jgi:hypothetical protein